VPLQEALKGSASSTLTPLLEGRYERFSKLCQYVDQSSSVGSDFLRPVGYGVGYGKRERGRMNEQDIQDILVALLTEDSVRLGERGEDAEPTFEAVSTFDEAGVVSDHKGLVISAGDGSVFLVTIERGE
jgi:hypothetical protein